MRLNEIGAELRRLRLEQGLTQAEVAKRSGVSQATISMLERGLHGSTINVIAKVAHGLGYVVNVYAAGIDWEEDTWGM